MLNQQKKKKKVKDKEKNNNKEINLDLNKKLVRFVTHLMNTSTTRRTVEKTHTKQNNGIYNTCHGLISQEWILGDIDSRSDFVISVICLQSGKGKAISKGVTSRKWNSVY